MAAGKPHAHEHYVIMLTLEYLGCFDQVNLPALLGAEILARRAQLIESAYEASSEAPRFEGAEHFMGYKDTDNGVFVDPQARKLQALGAGAGARTHREQGDRQWPVYKRSLSMASGASSRARISWPPA